MGYGAGLPGYGAGRGTGYGAGAGGRYGAGTGSGYGAGLAADWTPLSLSSLLAAWYKADAGCYTDAACLFASASSQYLSKTSPTFAPTTRMTIAFDYKPTTIGAIHDITGRWSVPHNQYVVRLQASGVLQVFVADNNTTDTGNNRAVGSSTLIAGTNYRIVIVYDGALSAANRLAIYVNGVAETLTITGTIPATLTSSGSSLFVGSANLGAYSNGTLARLGFSSDALSGAALTAAHTSTFWADMTAARQADWFSFYNLCEASSTRVDSTGLNNLTPTNGPTVAAGPGEGAAVNNSPVKRIEDQSGNARHLLQSTIASQPLWMAAIQNGRPVLRFDGVDDSMRRDHGSVPWDADVDGIFYLACAAQRSAAVGGFVFSGSATDGWSSNPNGGIFFSTGRLPGASLYDGAAYRNVQGSAVTLGVFSSIVSSYAPADAFLRVVVDGVPASGSHAMDTTQSTRYTVAGRNPNVAAPIYSFVDVGECAIGRYGLNASNRAGASGYLKSRWGTA